MARLMRHKRRGPSFPRPRPRRANIAASRAGFWSWRMRHAALPLPGYGQALYAEPRQAQEVFVVVLVQKAYELGITQLSADMCLDRAAHALRPPRAMTFRRQIAPALSLTNPFTSRPRLRRRRRVSVGAQPFPTGLVHTRQHLGVNFGDVPASADAATTPCLYERR